MTGPDDVFYHGTRRGFGRGGYLWPRSFHRSEPTTAPVKPGRSVPAEAEDYIYFTTSIYLAWAYAYKAVGRGKPKVLVIQPSSIEPDPEHSRDMQAYRSREIAKVLDVLTEAEAPMTEEEANSGWVEA